jgi:hypothetical protein
MLLQAMLALMLSAGPRAIGGPLHWHDAVGGPHGHAGHSGHGGHSSHPDAVARHHHDVADGAVWLESAAQAAEDLSPGGAAASALAAMCPLRCPAIAVPHPGRDPWPAAQQAAAWADAAPGRPEVRPRG